MAKNNKLVYQIFDCTSNSMETRKVSVNNKETARLVTKGIVAERNAQMRDTRRMFTMAYIEIVRKFFKKEISVAAKVNMLTKRVGVTKGYMQKIDILLTNSSGTEFAILLENTAYTSIDPVSHNARSNHIYKTYKGRAYTYTFHNFLNAASNVDKYAKDTLGILEEMQENGFIKGSTTLPSFEEVRDCFDKAIDSTIIDKTIALV